MFLWFNRFLVRKDIALDHNQRSELNVFHLTTVLKSGTGEIKEQKNNLS